MKVHLFSMLCLDEDEHPDLNLYRHFIDHYRDLGIGSESFNIIPCGVDTYRENFEDFKEINKQNNIQTLNLISKKYDIWEAHKIYLNWCTTVDGEDWVTMPDPDEFNDYGHFDKIQNCINFLEENNYEALRGELMDRIAKDLGLNKVRYPDNLFAQFPVRANITKHILQATWEKLLLCKVKVKFPPGHHDIIWKNETGDDDNKYQAQATPRPTPGVYNSDFKAFHFKWTEPLLHRLNNTKHENLYKQFTQDRERTESIITGNKFNIIIQ